MRENKYRAWNKEYRCMDNDFYIRSDGVVFDDDVRKHDTPNIEIGQHNDRYILMQYIGKKDKNGKEIYECDIVRHYNVPYDNERFVVGVVFFDEESCSFKRTGEHDPSYYMKEECVYEVIGNIYENPELLSTINGTRLTLM